MTLKITAMVPSQIRKLEEEKMTYIVTNVAQKFDADITDGQVFFFPFDNAC